MEIKGIIINYLTTFQLKVHEVVDRVDDLQKNWPPEWGEVEGNIGVVAPYSDQVTLG